MMRRSTTAAFFAFVIGVVALPAWSQELRPQAEAALRKAVDYFRTQVSVEGGYLWSYSEDLSRRAGERQATATMAWVQPPGTPSVGMAYLSAYQATGDGYLLDAARETAHALVKGQLNSGGWDYHIEFDPRLRRDYPYRADGSAQTRRNTTTLDDNTTQSALLLLMRVDQALEFKDAAIHEAAEYALDSLLKAQYPNGAWPQRFDQPPEHEKFPVRKASFNEAWSRTWPGDDYRGYYTLNDNSLADMIDTLLAAARIYNEPKYRAAALKGADFLLLAQLPEPQPAWAQQYDAHMQPAWARKFEPAAITGGESQTALRLLLRLYRETGETRYLQAVPPALAYLRRSVLPDGRLARFYEQQTNKPLYFTKDYQLTYRDDDLPTHYGFKVSSRLDSIAAEYERLRKLDPAELKQPQTPSRPSRPRPSGSLTSQAKAAIASLDAQGRWLDEDRTGDFGPRVLQTRTFIRNVEALSTYLSATQP
jgi:PelA/Pel-15E family pectate lyase